MYDYKRLLQDITALNYESAEIFSIGKSAMGKDIPCIKIGNGEHTIMLNGAHHGLEYITSALLMRFANEYCECIDNYSPFHDIFPHQLLNELTLYLIPMINPDGVDIAIHGLDITNPYHRDLISKAGIHSFNTVWQANANGVDLNHNYDADWKIIVSKPAPTKYAGTAPEDQPESKAVADFIRNHNCDMLLCFHSQGREIYYDFNGILGESAADIAYKMSLVSGYVPSVPTGSASFGGCKDWFINEFNRYGFTIEVGCGKNPLPEKQLDEIYEENSKIIVVAIKEVLTNQRAKSSSVLQ